MSMNLTAEELIERYADMVYRLALTEVKNKTDAEDIFQEVFIRLVKNLHKLDSEEHAKAWLIRVTINCTRKHFASYWNRNIDFMSEDADMGRESEELANLLNGESPVLEAVCRLPEKYRIVVHLFYFEDFSVANISKILKTTENTIKSQLHRARKLLKEMLEGGVNL